MKKIFTAFLCFAGTLPSLAQETRVNVSPLSLKLVYKEVKQAWIPKTPGFSFDLLFRTENGALIAENHIFDKKANLSVTDSAGNNLGKVTTNSVGFINIKPDNLSKLPFSFSTEKLPAAKGPVTVKGTHPVILLTDSIISEPTTVDIKEGSTFTIGDLTFILKVSSQTMVVESTTNKEIPYFKLLFTDMGGNRTVLKKIFADNKRENGTFKTCHIYRLDDQYEQLNIVLKTWEKSEKINVPIDLSIDISGQVK